MSLIYPKVSEVKKALFDLKDVLPEIEGRNGLKTHVRAPAEFNVLDSVEETINALNILPFKSVEPIKRFTEWFIDMAFRYAGEGAPKNVAGYCGVVGLSGQYVDYPHKDSPNMRITSTIASDPTPNPSTICWQVGKVPINDDDELLKVAHLAQIEEGGITVFINGQYHQEKTLPIGTAKIMLSATYDFTC